MGDNPAAAGDEPDDGPGVAAAAAAVPAPGAVGEMSMISSSNRFRLMARELRCVSFFFGKSGPIFYLRLSSIPPPLALVVLCRGGQAQHLRRRREPGQTTTEIFQYNIGGLILLSKQRFAYFPW